MEKGSILLLLSLLLLLLLTHIDGLHWITKDTKLSGYGLVPQMVPIPIPVDWTMSEASPVASESATPRRDSDASNASEQSF